MCKCTPYKRTPFCGQPDCEWLEDKETMEEYTEWVDNILCRYKSKVLCSSRKYTIYSTISYLVNDLYHQKHRDSRAYHEQQPEIMRMIAEVVAMTLFAKEKFDEHSSRKDYP